MPGCVLLTTPQTATPLSFALSIQRSIACFYLKTTTQNTIIKESSGSASAAWIYLESCKCTKSIVCIQDYEVGVLARPFHSWLWIQATTQHVLF